jgi:hypothetical protein
VTTVENSAPSVVVERWRRYGHDRAYVRIAGERIGYRDLKSGAIECGDPRLVDVLTRATDHLLRRPDATAGTYTPRHSRDNAPPTESPAGQPVEAAPEPDATSASPENESDVAVRLGRLPTGWHVLHAVPIGERGSVIDHVVIGPAGVFTVSARHHPDSNVWVFDEAFKVDGDSKRYVRVSRVEARRASKVLSDRAKLNVRVRGVIAVTGAQRGFAIIEQPRAVTVVTPKTITAYLHSLPCELDAQSVERIYEATRELAGAQSPTPELSRQ